MLTPADTVGQQLRPGITNQTFQLTLIIAPRAFGRFHPVSFKVPTPASARRTQNGPDRCPHPGRRPPSLPPTTPPAPTIIGAPSSGDAIPGTLAGPALEAAADGQLSTRVATITDGTHTPAERTNDPDWNRATYSGKNKAHTYNTNITTAPDGTIIGISETVPGSTNDLTLLRESPADFGALSDPETNPETPGEDHRPINIHDRGHRGIQKDTPGAEARIGIKPNTGSDPETGGLTQEDLDHNTEVTRVRIVVEHAIGRIKQYRITTKPYHGTPGQFNDELNVVPVWSTSSTVGTGSSSPRTLP